MNESIYSFSFSTPQHETISLADFRDKVLLVVNTASQCGFTPQYEGLESLHKTFGERGLVVLGFPCNQFGAQEPGTSQEALAFCQTKYGVSFPLSEKIDVNGAGAHPLFRYLTQARKGLFGTEAIKWNFTKFLINRHGEVVDRYPPQTTPAALSKEIEALLDN